MDWNEWIETVREDFRDICGKSFDRYVAESLARGFFDSGASTEDMVTYALRNR